MANTPSIVKAIGNKISTTLSNALTDSATTITVADGSGMSATGGYIMIDEAVTGKREIIYVESVSSNTLTVSTNGRGTCGTTAVAHDSGAVVTDVIVDSHVNGIAVKYRVEHGDDGTHSTTYVVTPDGTQTLTNKTLTSPAVNTPTLVLADSSPTADGSIGFDRTGEDLQVGDGSNSQVVHMGAWTSFTPSWTHLTVGNGTNIGYYCQIGKTVFVNVYFSLGSTSSVGAAEVSLTLPVTANAHNCGFTGCCQYVDYGTATYGGFLFHYGTLVVTGNSAAYTTYVYTTSPFTWTTGDAICINCTYESA